MQSRKEKKQIIKKQVDFEPDLDKNNTKIALIIKNLIKNFASLRDI